MISNTYEVRMQLKCLSRIAIGAMILAVPAAAHHSHNAYDQSAWTTYEGTIQEVHLINPHSWIYVEMENDEGETTVWALEAGGPNGILSRGVGREDLQSGDAVRVRCHKLRDGSPGCLLGFVTPMHGDTERGHGVERQW